MKQDIIKSLIDWKKDQNKVGVRSIYKQDSPFGDGEYLIKIQQVITIDLEGKKEKIDVSKKMLTYGQAKDKESTQGDLIRLTQLYSSVSTEVTERTSQAIDKLMKDYENFTEFESE